MELKEFVTETLMQIIEGIKDAQEKSSELGAIINPRSCQFRTTPLVIYSTIVYAKSVVS